MVKETKKPTKFKNMLENLDNFPIEHTFQFTKKAAKGTVCGFFCSTIGWSLLGLYLFSQCLLFVTHDAFIYSTTKIAVDFEELGTQNI
jgi:hypothetical protein